MSDDGLTALVPMIDRACRVKAYALIDADDAVWIGQWRWSLGNDGYAFRRLPIVDGNGDKKALRITMHREILGLSPGDALEGDHINRDRLDNRRANLREASRAENVQNISNQRRSVSSFRGVVWNKRTQRWVATIRIDQKRKTLGYFRTEEDAAEAARSARARLMPFATD